MAAQKTVKVKLNTPACGQSVDANGRPGNVWGAGPGDIVNMPADDAQRYIDRGFASAVQTDK